MGAVPDDGDRTATAGSGVAVLHLQCPGPAGRAAVQDLTPGNPQGGLRRRGTTPARTESPARHGSAVAGASGVCDGSSLNLPRGLVHEGWRTPVDGAHYPQGLVSCLYRLQARLPVDFDLHAHGNERAAALAHLNVLSANDVVVYDRGYYSYEMLHAVFRMQRKTGIDVDRFIHSGRRDTVIEVVPRQRTLTRLPPQEPRSRLRPTPLAAGEICRGRYRLHPGHDPAGPGPVFHRAAVGSVSREMGHRGTVQGIQTADGG